MSCLLYFGCVYVGGRGSLNQLNPTPCTVSQQTPHCAQKTEIDKRCRSNGEMINCRRRARPSAGDP